MPIDQPPAIVEIVDVNYGRGGNLSEHLMTFDDYRKRGVQVRITGVCYFACTFVTRLPERRVCVTAHARLVFHQATLPNGERSDDGTTLMMDSYPYWVRAWIAGKGLGILGPGYIVMGTKELTQHYSICPSGDVALR
jgi:hypothetical protein